MLMLLFIHFGENTVLKVFKKIRENVCFLFNDDAAKYVW